MKLSSLVLFGAATADNRAHNECTEYVTTTGAGQNAMFMNLNENGVTCNMRLGAGYSNTGKLDTLVDEGYVTLTYEAGFVNADSVVTPDSAIYEVSVLDNQIRFDFPDSMSGNGMVIFTFTVDNPALCSTAPTSFQYCTGTSPTESTPTADENSVSDASQCQSVTLTTKNDQSLFNLESDPSTNTMSTAGFDASSYLELEFSGYVRWMQDSLPAGFDRVVNVADNVYRIYMSTWSMDWIAHLDHIGSPQMEPDINWAHVCPGDADKEDLSAFAASGECTVLDKYMWQAVQEADPPAAAGAASDTLELTVLYDQGVDGAHSLRDESYLIITHGAHVEGSVQGAGVDSATVDGRTVTLEIDDNQSGNVNGIYALEYTFPDGMSYVNDITTVQLCRGASPTASPTTTPTNSEHCQDITQNVAGDNAWACRSCYKFSGDNSAFSPAIPWRGYMDVEFAGEVEFMGGVQDPFESVENVMGNVWRFTFNQIMETVSFDLDLGFTGSLGMAPRVNWAQGCMDPSAPVTEAPTSEPPTAPPTNPPAPTDNGGSAESRLCVPIEVTVDKTVEGTVDKYAIVGENLSGDINDDNAVQDDESYLELTFSENLGFVSLPGFSFEVEVLVNLETYAAGNIDGGSIEGNVITLDLGGDLIGQQTININFGVNYNLGGQTGTSTGTFTGAQLCNRINVIQETTTGTTEVAPTTEPTPPPPTTTTTEEAQPTDAPPADCPCTEGISNSINYGYIPNLSKYGQIKQHSAGANVTAYSISHTVITGTGDTAVPGMQSKYDGYLVLQKFASCNHEVLIKFQDAERWIADLNCPTCYTSFDSHYWKSDVAGRKRTFTFGYHFDGDLALDTNKDNSVDKYVLFIKGLQAAGVTEQQAFDCFAGAKPANIFPHADMKPGCDYSHCVGEKILIW